MTDSFLLSLYYFGVCAYVSRGGSVGVCVCETQPSQSLTLLHAGKLHAYYVCAVKLHVCAEYKSLLNAQKCTK